MNTMKYNFLKVSALALVCGFVSVACQSKSPEQGATTGGSPEAVAARQVPGAALSELRIATVNMDSINNGFQMVADIQREIQQTEERLMTDIQNQANRLQKDYDNYLKVGATMTLSDQRKKEEELSNRQQEIANLQQTYSNQMVSLQAQRMEEVTNRILDYIKRYNEANAQYSLIITSGSMSGVLYAVPSMDITSAVLKGLNDEYKAEQSKK